MCERATDDFVEGKELTNRGEGAVYATVRLASQREGEGPRKKVGENHELDGNERGDRLAIDGARVPGAGVFDNAP